MRHVAEGELHAYLDGGLEHFPPEEAERVRRHVESCPDCRARLDEERALLERAGAVLAQTGPGAVEAPPFEELRKRALAADAAPAGAGGGWSRPALLRTAAVAVLALGVGWAVGRQGTDVVGTSAGGSTAAMRPAATAAAPEDRTTADAATETAPEDRSYADAAALPGPPAEPTGADDRPATGDVMSAAREVEERPEEAEEVDLVARQAEPEAPPTEGVPVRAEADPSAGRGAPAVAAEPLARDVAADEAALPRTRPTEAPKIGEALSFRGAPAFPPAPQEGPDARPLTVPGLPVVSVEWTEVAPDRSGLRVLQRLTSGDLIELRFGGLDGSGDVPPYLLRESLPEGIRQVVVEPFGRGWLVVRAPLEEAQIRALVALIS